MNRAIFQKQILFLFDKLLNLLLFVSGLVILWLIGLIFFWASFNVPSHSMEPEIVPGDRVVVWKPWMGARIFDLFALMDGGQPEIYRMPGFHPLERGDVVVFNYPYANGLSAISMNVKNYYIKRCIALPGDTLSIEEGLYKIKGFQGILGNLTAQHQWAKVPEAELKQRRLWSAYPNDLLIGWNVRNFGPLFVPAMGTEIKMNPINILLYRPLIEWESKETLCFNLSDSCCYLGNQQIQSYRFRYNYYFMAGDRVESSEDSRYWGLVPEPFIVGKVGFISESRDPNTGEFRWGRWLKRMGPDYP